MSAQRYGGERVVTGVRGLDDLLDGGLPRGSWTLVFGPPGSGKTVLGLHFCWAGYLAGEKVSYDSADRPVGAMLDYLASFGKRPEPPRWQWIQTFPRWEALEREGAAAPAAAGEVWYGDPDFESIQQLDLRLSAHGCRRLVCGDYLTDVIAARTLADVQRINRWTLAWAQAFGVTGIDLVTGDPDRPPSPQFSAMCKDMSNIIVLRYDEHGRYLRVLKLEGSTHPLEWLPFTIDRDGLRLL